jgi:hypothetical protein
MQPAVMYGRRRRRTGAAPPPAGTPTDVTDLITAMGVAPRMFWDVRGPAGFGLVLAGSSVTAVDDIRGVATWPANTMSAGGSRQPVWDGTTVNFDGVDDALAIAASALLDMGSGDITFTLIGSVASGVAGNFVSVLRNAAATRWMSIRLAASGGAYQGRIADSAGTLNVPMGVPFDSTMRAMMVGNRVAPRGYEAQVPDVAIGTGIPTGTMSIEAYQFVLGAFSDTGATPTSLKWRAAAIWPAYLTAAQMNAWRDWAVANHAAVVA